MKTFRDGKNDSMPCRDERPRVLQFNVCQNPDL